VLLALNPGGLGSRGIWDSLGVLGARREMVTGFSTANSMVSRDVTEGGFGRPKGFDSGV
jgi:hypothetical protein